MSNWSFFDWLAYAPIALSALIMAIRGEWSKNMTPTWLSKFFSKTLWAYAPLVLILISASIFVAKELEWIGPSAKVTKEAQFIKWPDPYQPISAIGKTFRNEKVVLDEHSYSNCKFYNVTFVYNGTTAIQFNNNEIHGAVLSSDNPAVNGAFVWMLSFKDVVNQFKLEMPPSWEPIKKAP